MWQTVGQEGLIWFLKRSFEGKSLSHAYLFLGPEGVGKRTLALDFASALNCLDREPPCGYCPSCRRIQEGIHPDVLIIYPLQKEIGIDQIRQVIASAYLPPYEGRYKFFIIDGAESFSKEAGNCLLKTLEEPPPKVIFILLAEEERDMLPTLVSRCHCLNLTPLPKKIVISFLKDRGFSEDKAELLARICGGCLGRATDEFLEKRKRWLEDLERLFFSEDFIETRFVFADELAASWEKDRRSVLEGLSLWQGWWHDLLLLKAGLTHLVSNIDLAEGLKPFSMRFSPGQIKDGLKAMQMAVRYLRLNVHPRLVFHTLMLSLPR